jgi:hypothetical protein
MSVTAVSGVQVTVSLVDVCSRQAAPAWSVSHGINGRSNPSLYQDALPRLKAGRYLVRVHGSGGAKCKYTVQLR